MSAGLAAPLIGAGAVAVLGSGSAAIFTGASGLAVITSIFGAAGAGLTGKGGGFSDVVIEVLLYDRVDDGIKDTEETGVVNENWITYQNE